MSNEICDRMRLTNSKSIILGMQRRTARKETTNIITLDRANVSTERKDRGRQMAMCRSDVMNAVNQTEDVIATPD